MPLPESMLNTRSEYAVTFYTDPDGMFQLVREVTYSRSINVKDHVHAAYEIYLLVSGRTTAYVEGASFTLRPGDLLVVNRRELHRFIYRTDSPMDRIKLYFVPEYIVSYQPTSYGMLDFLERRRMGESNLLRAEIVVKLGILELVKALESTANENLADTPLLLRAQFLQLIVLLNRAFRKSGVLMAQTGAHQDRILVTLAYLNEHLAEPIVLDRLAEVACISKYHLCRVFRSNTGFTVHEYVLHKRIQWAKELLLEGRSALETCHLVGFNDYSNFYRNFKMITKVTPQQFQKVL
jgi:AraC-like DNA-binding protein/quercetin dioxygenase-like cupin family protein